MHYVDKQLVTGQPAGAHGFLPIKVEQEFIGGYWVTDEALIPGKRPRTPGLEAHLQTLNDIFPLAKS